MRKGRTIPARVETVVIYLPDVRPCIPTRLEWDDLNAAYRRKLDQVLNPPPPPAVVKELALQKATAGPAAEVADVAEQMHVKQDEKTEAATAVGEAEEQILVDRTSSAEVTTDGDCVENVSASQRDDDAVGDAAAAAGDDHQLDGQGETLASDSAAAAAAAAAAADAETTDAASTDKAHTIVSTSNYIYYICLTIFSYYSNFHKNGRKWSRNICYNHHIHNSI